MNKKAFFLIFTCITSCLVNPLFAERIYTSEHVYETGKILGKGKRGRVLEATDELGRLFAIKVMYTKEEQIKLGCSTPEIKHMFDSQGTSKTAERAFEIGLAMDHPGIIKCYELIVQNNRSWTVLEYVRGLPLNKIPFQKFTRFEAVTLALDFIEALSYAASNDIVHRDLCTQNLMVDTNNRLKLIDLDSFQSLHDKRMTKRPKLHKEVIEKINWVFVEVLKRGQFKETEIEDYFHKVFRLTKFSKYREQLYNPMNTHSGNYFVSYLNSLKYILLSQDIKESKSHSPTHFTFW